MIRSILNLFRGNQESEEQKMTELIYQMVTSGELIAFQRKNEKSVRFLPAENWRGDEGYPLSMTEIEEYFNQVRAQLSSPE